jgi:hypothetical protein
MPPEAAKKKCFVVMGFGTKTDFQQQKTYDLDKSYRIIIRKAVEEAGLECIRADDIIHSGIIDKPMYELLLGADVVVADLSTSNANAIYELGVRHALRPHTTIVIAEKNFKFPFDIGHLLIRPYNHLGEGIDAEDAETARAGLKKAIEELLNKNESDSPVYTFLPTLCEPTLKEAAEAAAAGADAVPRPPDDQTVSLLMRMFRDARAVSNWAGARLALEQLKIKMPSDPFVVQQLALATYKSKQPDAKTALAEARTILSELHPETTNDPETLGIWGAIHKRMWELDSKREDLDEAIRSYGKGFNLKDDFYNGINYAFMLNVRAGVTAEKSDAIADFVWARRVRQRVIELAQQRLAAGVKDDHGNEDLEQKFWLRATLIEALVGTGESDRAEAEKVNAIAEAPESWMAGSLQEQLEKLKVLLAQAPV